MSSKHLAELCSLLVREVYGELPSRIVSTLFTHGRLSLTPLSLLSNLPLRSVRHGLAVLLQHSLLYYFTSDNDGQTFYEVNVRNIYDIARYGKIMNYTQECYGTDGAEVISLLQKQGHATAPEVVSVEKTDRGEGAGDKPCINGDHEVDDLTGRETSEGVKISKSEGLVKSCQILLKSQHVVECTPVDYIPPTDFHDKVENHVFRHEFNSEVKGKDDKIRHRLRILKRKAEWLDANIADPYRFEGAIRAAERESTAFQNGRKRQVNGDGEQHDQNDGAADQRPNKKRKVNGNISDHGDASMDVIDESNPRPLFDVESSVPSYRINRDKFDISFRSQYLVDMANRYFGDTTAQVYRALLRRLEHSIPRCHDEYAEAIKEEQARYVPKEDGEGLVFEYIPEPSATTKEIERDLIRSLDLNATFPTDTEGEKPTDKHAKIRIEIPQENGIPHDDDAQRFSGKDKLKHALRLKALEKHLTLLSEHSFHFCYKDETAGYSNWSVDFKALTRTMIQFKLESVVTARFGPLATRMIRMLHAKGKLDEKQLGAIGLVRQKDLRRVLTQMQEAGFVDTQEVPRDNTRQPSRTIYLWFYDQDRCRKLVLDDTYKGMARVLQRAKVEQEAVQSVLDKAERTDVKGREDEFLNEAEQMALKGWRETEMKMLVQLARMDDLVALLRDYLFVGV